MLEDVRDAGVRTAVLTTKKLMLPMFVGRGTWLSPFLDVNVRACSYHYEGKRQTEITNST